MKRNLKSYSPREVLHTYGGCPLRVQIADWVAEESYDHDWPELSEIAFLRKHSLKPGSTVFDLGAHQGVVALMLSRAVGPAGKVVAVEANHHNAVVAQRNCDLNEANQTIILHAAVAEKTGSLTFNERLNGSVINFNRGGIEVKAFSVDDLARQYGIPMCFSLMLKDLSAKY